MDALGTIGCRFLRNELRPGQPSGLNVPAAQAITFLAPVPEGQQPGPHIPQIVFLFAGAPDGLTVVAELGGRPGAGERHHLSTSDLEGLSKTEGAWVGEVDRWVGNILEKLSQPAPVAPGAFLQPGAHQQPGYGQPAYGGHGQKNYAYSGHGNKYSGYKYGGYHGKPGMGMGGALAMGAGGAALGFLGGMMLGDMIGDAMGPDMADASAAMEDPGAAMEDAGFDSGGFDDFGGGDFGEF
jgi:sporulation-control protein